MDAQQIGALMASGGGGAALLAGITGVVKWLSGASARERQKNTDLLTQRHNAIKDRDSAELERDVADRKRREAEEEVAMLQRQLILLGATPVKLRKLNEEKN